MKIGIITDIHEDADRLTEAIGALEKHNCDDIFCLGDIAGFDDRFYSFKYSKNLKFCIDCIKMNCRVVIPGNHDLNQLKKLPLYNTVFHFPDNWYDIDLSERKKISKGRVWLYENELLSDSTEMLAGLFAPETDRVFIEIDKLKILFSHSILPDLSGILTKKPYKSKDFVAHFSELEANKCIIGISGHLHPNGIFRVNSKKLFNPSFSSFDINPDTTTQFICPCIADGVQDNGYTILDTTNMTIESFPLRTPKQNTFLF